MSGGISTRNVRYCLQPVEDGRCGKPFSVYSIRAVRKYCDDHLPVSPHVPNPLLNLKTKNVNKLVADEIAMREWVRKQMGLENINFAREHTYTSGVAARVTKVEESLSKLKQDFKLWDDVDKLSDYTVAKRKKITSTIDKAVERILDKEVDNSLMGKLNVKVASLNTQVIRLEKELSKMKKQSKVWNTSLTAKMTHMQKREKKNKGGNKNDK